MTPRTMKSYLCEGLVIVASILVAFALDASWANYQESKVESWVLRELKEEFDSAKERIEFSIVEMENVIEASFELANSIGKDTLALSTNDGLNLANRVLNFNTLEVPSSVVDSIVASGQVRLISNNELRQALTQWPAYISDVRENHEWHRVETDEYLIPYLARYLPLGNAVVIGEEMTLAPSKFDYDLLSLQRDPVFEGRLAWRIRRQQATLFESKVLLDETDSMLALIVAEID